MKESHVAELRLHWSPRSPFVRKVMIAAHETGTVGRIETVRTKVAMVAPNRALLPDNPLGKIPTLVLPDGSTLYDSVVICEYLDTLHDGPKLFPANGPARFVALTRHALGNGMLDALILWRNERERAAPMQVLLDAFALKTEATLAALERIAPDLAATPFGIGHIAIGCALSYLDFRFASLAWRDAHPALAAWHASFNARPSVQATQVVDDA
jgi:glutathione S-transferase